MTDTNNRILLHHGSGGRLTQRLIETVFRKHFANDILDIMGDSALLETASTHVAFTTDSFVVKPIFFPGGNIGKLAICGTVNDIAVSGAVPMYLSAGFIIEEGFLISDLEIIAETMANTAAEANVRIVTGDTKVVEKGMCDGLFINTAGIGYLDNKFKHIGSAQSVAPGDVIIVNGTLGDHGMAILSARKNLGISVDLQSDCAPLNGMINDAMKESDDIHFMRDATRGGLATVLCELVENRSFGVKLRETAIPVREDVRGICEMLGFDPVYIANEGKMVMVVSGKDSDAVLKALKKHKYGKDAAVIGEITINHPGRVVMESVVGGNRIIEMLAGDQLPRIC